jgi:hypothetical protein
MDRIPFSVGQGGVKLRRDVAIVQTPLSCDAKNLLQYSLRIPSISIHLSLRRIRLHHDMVWRSNDMIKKIK